LRRSVKVLILLASPFRHEGAINVDFKDIFSKIYNLLLRWPLSTSRDGIIEQANAFSILFSILSTSFRGYIRQEWLYKWLPR
jgi:hypothetical protein